MAPVQDQDEFLYETKGLINSNSAFKEMPAKKRFANIKYSIDEQCKVAEASSPNSDYEYDTVASSNDEMY